MRAMSSRPDSSAGSARDPDSVEHVDVSHEELVGEPTHVVTDEPVESSGTTVLTPPTPKPTHQLRRLTLGILVGIVASGLVSVCVGLAAHWFDQDFAKTIIQTVVSPVLGALSAVVGYLFADRKES
jgi:hypothetical protein